MCRQEFERPDVAACPTHDAVVCSLCLSTDTTGDHVLPAAPAVARPPSSTAEALSEGPRTGRAARPRIGQACPPVVDALLLSTG